MRCGFSRCSVVLAFLVAFAAVGRSAAQNGGDFSTNTSPTEQQKVPTGVNIVKGAWASASDSTTPVPEGGTIANKIYTNQYFGLSYPLPGEWFQKFSGPPPSDSGRYVLAQLRPTDAFKGPARGTILITAQDMFLATEIRCHAVQLVVASRDTKLLESLVLQMDKMKLPDEAGSTAGNGGGAVPVCIKDYANDNVLERVDAVLTERRFNAVPVRIIIDKQGKVKYIHFLSAFPEQAKAIGDALRQWKFRPYERNGQRLEVETGIMFGRSSLPTAVTTSTVAE